jgi:hypothetical protein
MNRSFNLKPSIVHEKFGDETVILNLESGCYYSAQDTSSVIWNLVSEGCSQADILRRLHSEYSGDDAEIVAGTAQFLDQLVAEGLVEARSAPDPDVAHLNGVGTSDKAFSTPLLQKYTDMEEMLLLDPIHEVDDAGWPTARQAPR